LIFKPQNIKAVIPAMHDGEYHGMWYILDMQNRLWYQGQVQYAYQWRTSNDAAYSRPTLIPGPWGHHDATVGTTRYPGKVHVTPMTDLHHSGHVHSDYYHHWMICSDGTIWGRGDGFYYAHGHNATGLEWPYFQRLKP
jgi:hypothetical protein